MKLDIEDSCWVDKYKPKASNELRGQIRCIRRIKEWLASFEPQKSKPLLFYGPPGIGKTTAAHLCCKEAGYKVVELNASDQRNKKIVEDIVRSMTCNSRINFFGRASETKDALIIDEVDGMAGNEDRGGIAALIQEIKRTRKPIIFICNDGQSRKIMSLRNYCETLEFRRPEVSDISSVVFNIASKESLSIDPTTVEELIESTNRDIRQVVNFLSLFKQTNKNQNFSIKTTRLNPFEATKKAFKRGESLDSRTDCFFADYNIIPLFIFENYCRQQPSNLKTASRKPKNPQIHLLKKISKAIDSICMGDLIEKQIRANQSWSLLPLHAVFSTAIPSAYMNSDSVGRIEFPQFLGKLSNAKKRLRMQQELSSHMCLQVRGGLNADYYDVLRERLTGPLIRDGVDGVDDVLRFMENYNLMREDLDSILELATWSFKDAPKIDTKVKAALTRLYKKANITLPYSVEIGTTKKRKTTIPSFEGEDDLEGDDLEDEEEEEVVPVPVKKPAVKPAPAKRAKK